MWKSLSHVQLFATPWTSLPGSTVHGILQAGILEWVAAPFSRGFSQSGDRTQASHIAGRFFTIWVTKETLVSYTHTHTHTHTHIYMKKMVNIEFSTIQDFRLGDYSTKSLCSIWILSNNRQTSAFCILRGHISKFSWKIIKHKFVVSFQCTESNNVKIS